MNSENIYYLIVFITAIYFLSKSGINSISFLIFLTFWEGFFDYLDNFLPGIWNSYKIFYFFYLIFTLNKIGYEKTIADEKLLNFFFIVFSISFLITYLINGGRLITILSQYLFKFTSIILLFYIVKEIAKYKIKTYYLVKLVISASLVQIFLSICKILIIGFQESNVGSIEYGSGGNGVTLPIIILIFFAYFKVHRLYKIKKFIYILPILIGMASIKRTPVFLYPIFYILTSFLHGRSIAFRKVLIYLPIIYIIFYLGIRLNPTLNPEYKIWGSFDINYAFDYAMAYNFGTKDIRSLDDMEITAGRGGSILLLLYPQKLGLITYKEIIFGKGLKSARFDKESRLLGGKEFGIQHIGLLSSTAWYAYQIGFLGLISMILMSTLIIYKLTEIRIRRIIFGFYIFELLLYGNLLMVTHSSLIIVLSVIFWGKRKTLA